MNSVISARNPVTMSSRDIADLVDSRHDSVKRAIERLAEKGVIQLPPLVEVRNHLGQTVEQFDIGKRDSYVIVAQLSPEFTAKLVDRWQELESRNAAALPQSFAESLRLAADLAEKNDQLQLENKQQSTKIASLESLFKEGMTATQYCKALNGVNVMTVNAYLFGRHWLFNESKTGTRWRVACYARDTYMTEHQQQITPHGAEPFIQYTPVLLKKGAARLHELYLAGELPMKKTWDGSYTHIKQERSAA